MRRFPFALVLLALALAVWHMARYYPALPDRVALRFGTDGAASCWVTRQALLGAYIALTAVLGLALPLGVGLLLRRFPEALIRVPKKSYWLAPARRAATLEAISYYAWRISAASLAFAIAMMHMTFAANMGGTYRLGDAFWRLGVAYLVFVAIWTGGLVVQFSRVPRSRFPGRIASPDAERRDRAADAGPDPEAG